MVVSITMGRRTGGRRRSVHQKVAAERVGKKTRVKGFTRLSEGVVNLNRHTYTIYTRISSFFFIFDLEETQRN